MTASPAPAIEFLDVTLGYGRDVVLREVCLNVGAGELLPMVGPNGGGKTTLLRALLGLLAPAAGTIRRSTREPPAYVPQQQRLDPLYPVTVREIVRLGLYRELGWWKRLDAGQRRRVDEVLELFGLTAAAERTFARLSGGQRQRTLLARAWLTGANLLVLDEPTTGLDGAAQEHLLHLLQMRVRDEARTVVMAHHDLNNLQGLALDICLVTDGTAVRLPVAAAVARLLGQQEG